MFFVAIKTLWAEFHLMFHYWTSVGVMDVMNAMFNHEEVTLRT